MSVRDDVVDRTNPVVHRLTDGSDEVYVYDEKDGIMDNVMILLAGGTRCAERRRGVRVGV
jgi:hypothetical protein